MGGDRDRRRRVQRRITALEGPCHRGLVGHASDDEVFFEDPERRQQTLRLLGVPHQCADPVARLVAYETGREPSEVIPYRVRPPVKPVTIGQMVELEAS